MPSLPKKVVLDMRCEKLFIDGEEFPWWITESGIEVSGLLDRNSLPTLTFSMFADNIEVIPKDSDEPGYTVSGDTTTEIVTNVYGATNDL